MRRFIAALPMYDWPEEQAATDAEWARLCRLLVQAGIDAPEHLMRRNADLPAVPGGIRDGDGRVIAADPATLPPDEFDFPTLWKHPDLLLAQTCWGPMEQGLAKHVRLVGQPSYDGIEGGQGIFYSSAIVMRRGGIGTAQTESRSVAPPFVLPDISPSSGEIGRFAGSSQSPTFATGGGIDAGVISPLEGEMAGRSEGGVQAPKNGTPLIPLDLIRGKRFAYNSLDSMSGIIALTRDLEALGETLAIFSERIETGGHRASIAAVAEGRADVAAIDCRSWDMAARHEPKARDVRVVGWTAWRKGLPMITSLQTPREIVEKLKRLFAQP